MIGVSTGIVCFLVVLAVSGAIAFLVTFLYRRRRYDIVVCLFKEGINVSSSILQESKLEDKSG